MPAQPGARDLRALVLLDELYGFVTPHSANPPTKRPIVSLMKPARAFGVGPGSGERSSDAFRRWLMAR